MRHLVAPGFLGVPVLFPYKGVPPVPPSCFLARALGSPVLGSRVPRCSLLGLPKLSSGSPVWFPALPGNPSLLPCLGSPNSPRIPRSCSLLGFSEQCQAKPSNAKGLGSPSNVKQGQAMPSTANKRQAMISKGLGSLSITKQCQALPSNAKQGQAMQSNAKHAIPSKVKQRQATPSNAKQCQTTQTNAK